jgi:hypothetical protein
MDTFSNT